MGRKKKVKKVANIIDNSVNYQGIVQVKLVHGDKVLSMQQYHNKGREDLFRFLALCLAGNTAEQLRPTKIKLFNLAETYLAEHTNPSQFNWEDACAANPGMIEATPYVTYSAAPVVEKKENSYEVTLHFTIPAAYISQNTVYVLGLYPNNASAIDKSAAYYLCVEDVQGEKVWKPLDTNVAANLSLLLDWTLSISNKEN